MQISQMKCNENGKAHRVVSVCSVSLGLWAIVIENREVIQQTFKT